MYARFTPRGRSAGRVAAKVVASAVATLTSIIRRPASVPNGYYQAPPAEPAVTARSPASPVIPVLRPFASSSSVASVTSPVVLPSDRPAQSPWPIASPSPDRVVVPVIVERNPPPVKYEQPQRWEYTQWDLTPIYPPERL